MLSKSIGAALLVLAVAFTSFDVPAANAKAQTAVVYSQPPLSSGGLFQSSHKDPDGSAYDQAIWDHFLIQTTQQITEIHWRGGYDPARFGSGGPVIDFRVAIHASIPGGTEPDIVHPPLVEYHTGGNAGETPAGTFGGAAMYDYKFTLPAPFQAVAGTKYWLQIEAVQHGHLPDWGMAAGTGSDGNHYRMTHVEGDYFHMVSGDAAFSLLARDVAPPPANKYKIYLPGIF
jgi:hypothetical protein